MTLEQWLIRLEGMGQNTIKLGLERVAQVAEKLISQPVKPIVITIGGTNGKGSCVATLEQCLFAQGYSVGAYTSPHLLHFNERIRINQRPASDQLLIEAFEAVEAASDNISLTYFELTTLAALFIFVRSNVDVMLLEVGLGGRLDAVNWMEPDISVITSIGMDHMHFLGSTLDAIGFEKAGIMRPNKPVVLATESMPESLMKHAKQIGAQVFQMGQAYSYSVREEKGRWSFQNAQWSWTDLKLPQVDVANVAAGLQVLSLLEERLAQSTQKIKKAIPKIACMGRFQRYDLSKKHILDVAHNPASCENLSKKLRALSGVGRFIAVFGCMADKDIEGMLEPFDTLFDEWFVGQLDSPRALTACEIGKYLAVGLSVFPNTYVSVEAAYWEAFSRATKDDVIVVFGSFVTVAAILELLNQRLNEVELDIDVSEKQCVG